MKRLSRSSSVMPLVLGMLSGLSSKEDRPVNILSHKIEQKEEIQKFSKQKMQRMKSKKNRKNRERNRQLQDTPHYASLRR